MSVKLVKQLFVQVVFLFTTCPIFSQSYDFTLITHQVTTYNNERKYENTIVLLEGVLTDTKATPYEKYQAYFLKYLTYKRLFIYDKAIANLELASEEGLKSEHKEQVKAQVKVEKLFIAFDLLKFDEVNQLLLTIEASDIQEVSFSAQGFYYAVLGTMEIKRQHYLQAEEYFTLAIEVFKAHDPVNLPMIYRKQIDLYRLMNQHEKALASFELGLYYAKKYKIDVYILNMYFDLVYFYTHTGDWDKAMETQLLVDQLNQQYNQGSVLGTLNVLETQLAEERRAKQEEKALYNKGYLFGSIALLLGLLVGIYGYSRRLRKNKQRLEEENAKLRARIVEAMSTKRKSEELDLQMRQLTDRQLTIVALVKLGKTNKEIGEVLFISENTVKYHLKNIYDLLRVNRRVEL